MKTSDETIKAQMEGAIQALAWVGYESEFLTVLREADSMAEIERLLTVQHMTSNVSAASSTEVKLLTQEEALCISGNMLGAVKSVRHRTELPLKEAKEIVESFWYAYVSDHLTDIEKSYCLVGRTPHAIDLIRERMPQMNSQQAANMVETYTRRSV